jgi:hypothetical protein
VTSTPKRGADSRALDTGRRRASLADPFDEASGAVDFAESGPVRAWICRLRRSRLRVDAVRSKN